MIKKRAINVILIEDNEIFAQLLQRMLLFVDDILLTTANDLRTGSSMVEKNTYHAALLDLDLPDSRGLETLYEIVGKYPEMPVVVLTGLDDEEMALRAVQAGAHDYLVKGEIGKGLLVRTIRYAIERKRVLDELERAKNELEYRVIERTAELAATADRLRSLTKKMVTIQEDERQKISRELHDEAGQALTALQISLEIIRNELPNGASTTQRRLNESINIAKELMRKIRHLAHSLRPPSLDAFGLHQALRDQCARLSSQTAFVISYDGTEIANIPDEVQITLYRVFQEAITNIFRHSNATKIEVELRLVNHRVILVVSDNGEGINPANQQTGIGLIGMKERVSLIGGNLSVNSEPGKGVALRAVVPIE